MATEKEIAALNLLVGAAIKANASSDRVNVNVDIDMSGVSIRISDPVVVAGAHDYQWDWLFYGDTKAYFSDEIFSEDKFLERCHEFISIVNGFEGHSAPEVAQCQ